MAHVTCQPPPFEEPNSELTQARLIPEDISYWVGEADRTCQLFHSTRALFGEGFYERQSRPNGQYIEENIRTIHEMGTSYRLLERILRFHDEIRGYRLVVSSEGLTVMNLYLPTIGVLVYIPERIESLESGDIVIVIAKEGTRKVVTIADPQERALVKTLGFSGTTTVAFQEDKGVHRVHGIEGKALSLRLIKSLI